MGQINSILQYNGPVLYADQIKPKLVGKTRAQEVEVLEQAARDLNGLINSDAKNGSTTNTFNQSLCRLKSVLRNIHRPKY